MSQEDEVIYSEDARRPSSRGLTATERLRIEKNKTKIRVGSFKIGSDTFLSRPYVYVPSAYLKNPSFNIDQIFSVLGFTATPNIIFRVFQTNDPTNWNVKLPPSKLSLADLIKKSEIQKNKTVSDRGHHKEQKEGHKGGFLSLLRGNDDDDDDNYDGDLLGPIRHHEGVLRENCKRLLRGAGQACNQAGGIFRINESWSSDAPVDAVAEWITGKSGNAVTTLGIAGISDYHPSIWRQLDAGAVSDFSEEDGGVTAEEVIIDPEPFYTGVYEVGRDEKDNRIFNSFPHPEMTHLIISDNVKLLEKKLYQAVPWGLIMINGSPKAADLFIDAIHGGLPVILFKYTGYTTDIACEMLEKAELYMDDKRYNKYARPEKPYDDDIDVGHHQPHWLKPFDEGHISDCEKLNVLIENWPDRFNDESALVVDMFHMSEDELQDRLTQTMGVAFHGSHELGGSLSEHKRLTYAWRMRHLFNYNAKQFKRQSDILTVLLILFTMFSTLSAVFYTYVDVRDNLFGNDRDFVLDILLKANLLLPLVATIIRGCMSVINPMMKYVALRDAANKLESEIYLYRTKVGKYSPRAAVEKRARDDSSKKDEKKGDQSKPSEPKSRQPRAVFASALDRIWRDLASSDVQNGSLKYPSSSSLALKDVNKRISRNRKEQDAYLQPMKQFSTNPMKNDIKLDISRKGIDIEAPSLGVDTIPDERARCFCFSSRFLCCCGKDSSTAVRVPRDDGLQSVSADEYVRWRLLPLAAEMSKKTPSLSTTTYSFTILIIFISISASALSTFGYSLFIPATLAVSGALTAWSGYHQTDMRLLQTNSSLSQLNQLLIWWDGLTMIEKRVPVNKDTLVQLSEAAILAQTTIYTGNTSNDDNDQLQ